MINLIRLLSAHRDLKRGNQTLLTDYLLTLPTGTTFNVMGGARIPNSRLDRQNRQAIVQYRRAKEIRTLQSLSERVPVILNGEIMTLGTAYKFIGRDYIPAPTYIGVDDSDKTRDELIRGRRMRLV